MITVSHEFHGYSDYWGGNGRRWDANAGCLFAFYDHSTTLKDCVDQWVDDYWQGGDCDSFPNDITQEDIREAILTTLLNDRGRADYESGALCEFAAECEQTDEDYDCLEYPVWIILVEIDTCEDCGAACDYAIDQICTDCARKHGYGV